MMHGEKFSTVATATQDEVVKNDDDEKVNDICCNREGVTEKLRQGRCNG